MSCRQRPITRPRRGTIVIYMSVAMVAFVAVVSLGVDVGHVLVVRNQLQGAADAAGRYAAAGLPNGVAAAQQNAVAAAAENSVDGSPLVIDPSTDVEFGSYDTQTGTFTVLSGAARSSANAVRVTARRTSARGMPVQLSFGALLGKSSYDLTISSMVSVRAQPPAGFIGYTAIDLKNNAFIGSYDSTITTVPTHGTADNHASVGSDGQINGQNHADLHGNAVLGPQGSVSGVFVTGSQQSMYNPLAQPVLPPWSPQLNPGNTPAAYSVSGNTVLPGGSYYFTSLSVSGTLSFSGPATLYVNGDMTLSGTLAGYANVPGNLHIYQYGSHRLVDGGNGITLVADVVAPGSDFTVQNNLTFYGRGVFNSITAQNNADFYFDQKLSSEVATFAVVTQR